MKKALIIFVRNPVLGRVKTRLAQAIGEEKALDIYKQLLAHTISITSKVSSDKFVYYSDFVDVADEWNNNLYEKRLQEGNELGFRMKNAFDELFNNRYEEVIIIGSDCYELNTSIIESGFVQLKHVDAVIGPSRDGGYYLLGLKKMQQRIFENKAWSTNTVCGETISDMKAMQLSYSLLPVLNDVDVETDVPVEYRHHTLE